MVVSSGRARASPRCTTPSRVVAGLERNPAHYVWNLASVLTAITAMASFAFWVDADDLSGRLGLNFTLVLTAVAFKYSVATRLPRIRT